MAAYPAPLIQELQIMETSFYLAAAGAALVVYDQVLRFSHEVNLVWLRRWSFMTALYLIARYFGSLFVIGMAAVNLNINWTYSGLVNILLVIDWAENIFLLTMQAILVVRVYALFNQSKKVLFFLITSYVLQATATFVVLGLILNKRVLDEYYVSLGPAIGSVTQPLTENPSAFPKSLNQDSTILLMVFDAILLLFALWAFVKHILEAKTLNGGWSINVLVRILVADHLLYFVCNLIWLSLSVASNYAETTNYIGILYPVFDALVVVFGPRMVISLRTTENKTRGEGGTLEGEVSTIQFGIREQPESAVEEGGGFRAADESLNVQMD